MTDSNTNVIRRYLKPSSDGVVLSVEDLRDLLQVNTISPTIYRYYRERQHILCSSASNTRAGWLTNDEASMQWLRDRNYIEVKPKPEEILT